MPRRPPQALRSYRPPLAEERAAVLDHYFGELEVRPVSPDSGWAQIRALPPLFPELQSSKTP